MAIKISRIFKDISLSFSKNPLTNDIIPLYNEFAIKKSVMNLIRTQLGERFFQPILGSSIESSLFELHNSDAEAVLPDRIKNVLSNYEPRIQVLNVEVTSNEDTHELGIEITYNIVGLPLPTQSLDFILQPSRL